MKPMSDQEVATQKYLRDLNPNSYQDKLEEVSQQLRKQRFTYALLGAFAALAVAFPVLLAASGATELNSSAIILTESLLFGLVTVPVLLKTGGLAFNTQLKQDLQYALKAKI